MQCVTCYVLRADALRATCYNDHMNQLTLPKGTRACVIVAHPDDEIIWLGGTILANPNVDWTIVCLARSADEDRAPKFRRVADQLNATAFQENLDDLERYPFLKHVRLAKELILKHTQSKEFDYVFTHGVNGEYGHRDHKSIHEAVHDLVERGLLKTKHVYYLHQKRPKKKVPLLIPRKGADIEFKLPEKIFAKKFDLITKFYGFDPKGIDANYCTKVEAFKIKRYN